MGTRRLYFRFLPLLVASALALALVPEVAAAQNTAEARRAFSAGVRAFESGNFQEALANFREAYRIRPHPSVLVNMANCFMEMGQPVEAAGQFERYLRESGEDMDSSTRGEVERALGSARAAIATVEVDGPAGTGIFINGESAGQTPLRRPIEVNPGSHTVELRHADGSVQEERVTVPRGGSTTVVSTPGGAPPDDGGGNGDDDGGGPPPDDGGGLDLNIPLLTWVFGGVAVVSLIGTIVFGATALSQQSEVEDLQAQAAMLSPGSRMRLMLEAQASETDDTRATNALLSDILLVTTLASAGAAIFFLITAPDDEAATIAGVGAAPLPEGGGMLLLQGAL